MYAVKVADRKEGEEDLYVPKIPYTQKEMEELFTSDPKRIGKYTSKKYADRVRGIQEIYTNKRLEVIEYVNSDNTKSTRNVGTRKRKTK